MTNYKFILIGVTFLVILFIMVVQTALIYKDIDCLNEGGHITEDRECLRTKVTQTSNDEIMIKVKLNSEGGGINEG